MLPPLAINWPLSSHTGYGVYGLHILLHYLRRGGTGFVLTDYPILPLALPPGADPDLLPAIRQAEKAAALLEENPQGTLQFDHPVLHGAGNPYAAFRNQFRVRGTPNVACAAIEQTVCPPDWRPRMKSYDLFISISNWNDAYLKSLGLGAPIHLCRLGFDENVFYPRPRGAKWRGRFVIFSGGKFEFRKGQDIVLAAFKRFREKHADALLVVSWQNQKSVDPAPFIAAGHCATVPVAKETGTDIDGWLKSQGLPEVSFFALPPLPNHAMAEVFGLCDIAIFPNRCEGGTNMVAKETMASGVPTYAAANTGQQDLIDLMGCGAFRRQTPIRQVPGVLSTENWRETHVDEVVEVLERVYDAPHAARAEALAVAGRMKTWSWPLQNEKLLRAVYGNILV